MYHNSGTTEGIPHFAAKSLYGRPKMHIDLNTVPRSRMLLAAEGSSYAPGTILVLNMYTVCE